MGTFRVLGRCVRRGVAVSQLLGLGAVLGGCGDEAVSTTEPASPRVESWRQIVPDPGMPTEVVSQVSHNNLDVVRHDGRVFFAFRTAPSHYASSEVVLYVVSSKDEVSWSFEAAFDLDTDLREPRFLSFDGRLWLYFAVLGTTSTAFEPGEARVSEYLGPGEWSESEVFYEPGFIPWRTRVVGGVPYIMGYVGGENIYDFGQGDPITIHWLTSEDGESWHGVGGGPEVVYEGGCSETDFAFLDDGSLVTVMRNEAGEGRVFGSRICRAAADALTDWSCVDDPRKYDSPLVFRHRDEVYLIARRNVSETGNFDLGLEGHDHAELYVSYQVDYWVRPKRCTLWRVDTDTLEVTAVLDLPSRGDTCFAGVIEADADAEANGGGAHGEPRRLAVYNYTSPLEAEDGGELEDIAWQTGQGGPTSIYRALLSMP